jgi:hypothetical protein
MLAARIFNLTGFVRLAYTRGKIMNGRAKKATAQGVIMIALALATATLIIAGCLTSEGKATRTIQGRVVLKKEITYGKGGDVDLKLDLARPAKGKGPFPALIFIHGGGWCSGSKAEYDDAIQQAANKGYVAVTIDYRLTKEVGAVHALIVKKGFGHTDFYADHAVWDFFDRNLRAGR